MKDKKIAVLGGGLSGRAVVELLEEKKVKYDLFDERGGDCGNPDFLSMDLSGYDCGIISPGFSQNHAWRKYAQSSGLILQSEVSWAARHWKGKLICITGTNGKTTLTEFLVQALERAGKTAVACGNIGRPLSAVCRTPPESCFTESKLELPFAICETSSFQAHDWLEVHPDCVIWTNFAEDHLDWHSDLREYFLSKYHLLTMGKCGIVSPAVEEKIRFFATAVPEGLRVVEPDRSELPDEGCFRKEPFVRLYALAQDFWKMMGLPATTLALAAREYQPGPHRMEEIPSVNDVRFVNDSKATNFDAVLAGVRSLRPPIIWIGGGSRKGGSIDAFIDALCPSIQSAHVYGETGPELAEYLLKKKHPFVLHPVLENAVHAAFESAPPGSTVYFSPGFASFDQYNGYSQRGNAFRAAVLSLKNPAFLS